MSNTINIRSDITDKFYRYKMPKLLAKIEGRGNGIKTVIPNMADIAKALSRPPNYPTKFFGCELGTLVTTDAKNDRYVVNGAHTAERLQSLLDVFIKKYVLCGGCGNPETDLNIKKNDEILRVCKACGAITPCDAVHRLSTYIIKNPVTGVVKKGAKREKKSKKGGDETPTADNDSAEEVPSKENEDEESDDEFTKNLHAEAERLKVAKLAEDEDDWAVDMSAEAVAARQKVLETGAIKKINQEEDSEDEVDPLDIFGDFVLANKKACKEIIKEEAERLGVKNDLACVVLFQTLFDEDTTDKTIKKHAGLLKLFSEDDEKAQKGLLGGFERLVGEVHPNLMSSVPKFLLTLYNEDVLEEQVLLNWGAKASKKYVSKDVSKEIRAKAGPFLEWLKSADEEDEDSD